MVHSSFWQSTPTDIWQGRDDSLESPNALRVFQTITRENSFNPEKYQSLGQSNQLALLGFMCDEGVYLNKGRRGAKDAPNCIRKALASFASSTGHRNIIDFGNIECQVNQLDAAQACLATHILSCHKNKLRTLVFGGGHETAFAHGLGLYQAHPKTKIGIINFDAHLDLRHASIATSGTPFKQLADYCKAQSRDFEYMCLGVSLAANTQALLATASDLNVRIILDTEFYDANLDSIILKIQKFIDSVDLIYLTIDLDVLSPAAMYAVSAPATLGIELRILLHLGEIIARNSKLKALDLVEYNPLFDSQQICAKVAARVAWQLCQAWNAQA